MKLSIFPDVKAIPTKAEKPNESKKTGVIRDKVTKEIIKEYIPEVVHIETEDDLIRCITNYAWSPSIFKGARLQENFISTDFAVLDIDNGMTILKAEEIVKESGFTCLCMPSTSNSPELNKFRLVFPLSRTITNGDDFKATMMDLAEVFPADKKCLEIARFFFGSTSDDGFWIEGDLLEPVKAPVKPKNGTRREFDPSKRVKVEGDIKEIIKELYGEDKETIPEIVEYFIKNVGGGLPGTWISDLNAFSFTLALQGIDFETIYDLVLYLAPRGELTKRDEDTIKRAVEDGLTAREN